jgi:anti-anti-sigma factor
MTVSVDTTGAGTRVLTLDGAFNVSSAPRLGARIREAMEAGTALVVDLRGVTLLDSTILRALCEGLQRNNGQQPDFALVRPNPLVWRKFVLIGLHRRFRSFRSLHEALVSVPPATEGAAR